jgi:hypothetical protein
MPLDPNAGSDGEEAVELVLERLPHLGARPMMPASRYARR